MSCIPEPRSGLPTGSPWTTRLIFSISTAIIRPYRVEFIWLSSHESLAIWKRAINIHQGLDQDPARAFRITQANCAQKCQQGNLTGEAWGLTWHIRIKGSLNSAWQMAQMSPASLHCWLVARTPQVCQEEGEKKPLSRGLKITWFVSENTHRSCFSYTDMYVYVQRREIQGSACRTQGNCSCVCSLSCYPLELTPSFSVSTYGAMIMKFNELNRELKGLIQHHLQRCLDSGRYYYQQVRQQKKE